MKHKQTLRRGLSVLLALVLCLSLLPATALAEETETSVEINETNFPDETFRTVAAKYDKDSDGALNAEEIQNATYMSCSEKDIASLEGIEYFTELTSLICNKNQLTELDISNNKKLVWLDCSNNQLTKLDFSNNTDLMRLYCNDNSLTSLDVSNNKKLTRFYCGGNSLTSLDLSENTKLEDFLCIGNEWYRITLGEDRSFDLSTLPGKFDVGRARDWSSGSVSGNILTVKSGVNSVTYTYDTGLEGNSVTCTLFWGIDINEENFPDANFRKYVLNRLDSNKNSLLEDSEIANAETFINLDGQYSTEESKITSLKGIEYFTELQYLYCSYNKLTELDLSKNTKLRTLKCNFNQLTKLDLSKNTELVWLEASANPQLGSLDITNSLNLDHLYVQAANLTELDVSQYTELEVLYCTHNQLTKLDVSQNKKLLELKCGENPLTTLNVSNNTALTSLDCHNCQLTSLDLSNNTALTTLDLFNNYYTIGVDETRTFDLNNLKQYGFDLSKVVSWTNGTVNTDGILTVASGATTVTYSYNCREDCDRDFHLKVVPKYTVAFNANGGSGTMAPASANKGSSYTLPECGFTAPEGKQFAGWALTDDGEVITDATITVKADTTLYAIWEDIPVTTYTVTFDPNGGSGSMDAVTVYSDENSYTLPECGFTAPEGQQFKGWATSASGEVISDSTITVIEDTTLYAIWKDISDTTCDKTADFTIGDGSAALALLNAAKTEGSADSTWDSTNKILTLSGVDFTTTAETAVILPDGATIELADGTTNTITSVYSGSEGEANFAYNSYGICTPTGSLTIEGSGQLTATGGTTSDSFGIWVYDNVTISGGTVTATGGAAPESSGISVYDDVDISGGTVKATGGETDSESYGIFTYSSIKISGGSVLAEASDSAGSCAALYSEPDLTGYASYRWRCSKDSGYTKGNFVWEPDYSYVEIVPGSSGSSSGSGGSSSGGGSSAPTYPPTVTQPENGAVTVSPKAPRKGDTVTITPKPEDGYTVEQILVTDKDGNPVKVTNNGDGTFSFTQPAGKVNVEVTFMEDNSMLNFFVDVPADAYYYDAVLWAADKEITGGTDAVHFSPDATCTRAQAVTFLWRAAGSPEPENVSSFADVPADSYYAKAVAWAVENGITTGTGDGKFSPDATCTRAQAMAFIWRSQKSVAADGVNPFTDVAADAYYAGAVQWAVENGVTNGTSDTTFSPASNCTRAQIVTFLFRCLGEE
ncbi:MAG: S-layer homology domain-containing protein [Clostridia bacterium]|nr:S-layer homology domain-containing protein [Clostridia bacterium]